MKTKKSTNAINASKEAQLQMLLKEIRSPIRIIFANDKEITIKQDGTILKSNEKLIEKGFKILYVEALRNDGHLTYADLDGIKRMTPYKVVSWDRVKK